MSLGSGATGGSDATAAILGAPLTPAKKIKAPSYTDPTVTAAVSDVDVQQAMMQGRLSTLATGGMGATVGRSYRPTLGGMP